MSALRTRGLRLLALALIVVGCALGSARADEAVEPAPGASAAPSEPAPSTAPAASATPEASESATAPDRSNLQRANARSTRYSAYVLPPYVWSLDVGLLGINADEIYGRLGTAVGLKHGFQLDANIGHWIAGLFGVNAKWAFYESQYIGLAAEVGFVYAHGSWLWLLSDLGQEVLGDSDLIGFPIGLTLSAPCTRWLEFDLAVQYQYSQVYGSVGTGATFYADTQFGGRQLLVRPTLRVFMTDATAFEFTARLPVYNRVPYEVDSSLNVGRGYTNVRNGYATVPFSDGWALEFGLRSQLRRWLFVTTRLHVGQIAKAVYGASIYPSFNLEFRLP